MEIVVLFEIPVREVSKNEKIGLSFSRIAQMQYIRHVALDWYIVLK